MAEKPDPKNSSGSKKNRDSSRVTHFVEHLAMGLGQVIPAQRMLLYGRVLGDLTDMQLLHGFDHALKYFKPEYGRNFPFPAELREWALQYRPEPITDTRRILDRGDKPPGWEPLDDDDRSRIASLQKAITVAAKQNTIEPTLSADEFERRRQEQIDRFRRKNKLA